MFNIGDTVICIDAEDDRYKLTSISVNESYIIEKIIKHGNVSLLKLYNINRVFNSKRFITLSECRRTKIERIRNKYVKSR